MTWDAIDYQRNTPAQNKENIDTFIKMMTESTANQLSWFDAYKTLYEQLRVFRSRGVDKDIAVVYYEDFFQPHQLCLKLMRFTHGMAMMIFLALLC